MFCGIKIQYIPTYTDVLNPMLRLKTTITITINMHRDFSFNIYLLATRFAMFLSSSFVRFRWLRALTMNASINSMNISIGNQNIWAITLKIILKGINIIFMMLDVKFSSISWNTSDLIVSALEFFVLIDETDPTSNWTDVSPSDAEFDVVYSPELVDGLDCFDFLV